MLLIISHCKLFFSLEECTVPAAGVKAGVVLGGLCGLGMGIEEGQGRALLLAQVEAAAGTIRHQQIPDQLDLTLLHTHTE